MEIQFDNIKQIIEEAGEVLRKAFYQSKVVSTKSNSTDLVTETDKKIERYLIDRISVLYPESKFLAEESSPEIKEAEYLWIIDPIDGTTNFVHKFPFVCISVALMVKQKLEIGLVYNPIMQEMFYAQRSKGAFLNGERIQVSDCNKLSEAFMGTGFAYNFATAEEDNIQYFKGMVPQVHGIRRPGSAALDLCYVAKGVYDGYWEWYLNPWDVSAGILIIQEAGGKVSNYANEEYSFKNKNIVASNGILHEKLLASLNKIKNGN